MNSDDKFFAEKTLKHLFLGSQVDGMQFGISPAVTKIYFTNFEGSDDFGGQLYLNIESKWCLFDKPPEKYPSNEDEIEDYSEDEEYSMIYKIRRQKVINIQLGETTPHLFIILENGCTLFVNGFHDKYESWQAGVQFDDWLVVSVPGDEIATWAPERFNEK
ncbi:hypothetical protein [Priestia koreensis]|uniref:hypothetical protein n=1 Tax=Priestia koreensis TaxID=284581 RepID=UPI001F58BDE2|nr:hypothetical protein [Priestia koreensis]UNL87452.1 hypothetical protein IE339_24355 [Priestia koreensis]